MIKFKVGDKVQTPLGVGIVYREEAFDTFLDEWHIEVVIGEKFGFNRVLTFETKDLEPYKTAEDKLLEIGFQLIDDIHPELKCYHIGDENKHMEVYINTVDKVFYVLYNETIDLELAKILTQYLEELENE